MEQKRGYCYCSFYANRRRIGGGYVPEGSTREERDKVARKGGIKNHNGVMFEWRIRSFNGKKLKDNLMKVKTIKGGGVQLKTLIPIR